MHLILTTLSLPAGTFVSKTSFLGSWRENAQVLTLTIVFDARVVTIRLTECMISLDGDGFLGIVVGRTVDGRDWFLSLEFINLQNTVLRVICPVYAAFEDGDSVWLRNIGRSSHNIKPVPKMSENSASRSASTNKFESNIVGTIECEGWRRHSWKGLINNMSEVRFGLI